jgi:DNA replication protein DnaC
MLSSTLWDELGYLALDQQTSNLFYQVISTRHARKRSTIITTNTLRTAVRKVFCTKPLRGSCNLTFRVEPAVCCQPTV